MKLHMIGLISAFLLLTIMNGQEVSKHDQKRDKVIFDVHYTSLYEAPEGFKDEPYKSVGYSFNWFKSIPFNPSISLGIGIGYSIHKVHSNFVFSDQYETGYLETRLLQQFGEKNKWVTEYIELPIELRFHTPMKNKFHWYMGVRPGYSYNQFRKYKTKESKLKQYQNTNFSPFKIEPTLRFGYGKINLIASANLLPVFKNDALKDVRTFSIGLCYMSGFER